MNLWFPQKYVAAILDGSKRDTVRSLNRQNNKLVVGERVRMSVGPRPAFATALITKLERLTWAELSDEKRQELVGLGMQDDGRVLLRVSFDDVREVSSDA